MNTSSLDLCLFTGGCSGSHGVYTFDGFSYEIRFNFAAKTVITSVSLKTWRENPFANIIFVRLV